MAKNHRELRVLTKLLEAGYRTEKAILTMTMEEMLQFPGVTVLELTLMNALQKAIRTNKVITFLGGAECRTEEVNADD